MLLAQLAETSKDIARTSSRSAKVTLLADLFRSTSPEEAPIAVTYLAGRLPQRRTNIGWRALADPVTPAERAQLTVTGVHRALDQIAAVAGTGAQAQRQRLLHALLGAATEDEQHFLVRLIGGELRQGALDALAVEGLAVAVGAAPEDVRRAVMLGGSLGAVAQRLLAKGPAALADFHLTVGRPVLPMLAHTASDVADAMATLGAPCALEEKLDGIRLQLHLDGHTARIYTRSLDDITDRLPDVCQAAAQLPFQQAVLDGELVALGPEGTPRLFQDIAGRVGSRLNVPLAQETLPLTPVFFDLLLLDGRDLLELPEADRHHELSSRLPDSLLARRLVISDPEEEGSVVRAERFAADVLAQGREGVVVKALNSPYRAGRRGRSWLKVKPVHTLDLVVLAAEWGHGRRTGKLSNLHLGARLPDGSFSMLGKTFKGLTDATLDWQTERLSQLAVSTADWGVTVRPELVVEVAFDGVQRSTRYPSGVTLRFARVVRYRQDKTAAQADTVDAVLELRR